MNKNTIHTPGIPPYDESTSPKKEVVIENA
jgi:hypothetical protein